MSQGNRVGSPEWPNYVTNWNDWITDVNRDEYTEWFPAEMPPARAGVYQLHNQSTDTLFYAHWNGFVWHRGALSIDKAAESPNASWVQCRWPWRGLKEPS